MANPSLQIGNSNWAIKEDNLLGYSTAGTRFVPQPITMTRASAGTRVNSSGLVETVELLGSEEITNEDFTQLPLGTGWDAYSSGTSTVAFTEGAVLSIDGSNSNVGVYQQNIFTSGVQYKIVVSVKATASFDALVSETDAASSKGTIGTLNLTTSYQDFSFYYTGTGAWDLFIHRKYGETAGQNQQIYVKSVSVKESTKNNLARVDYDGTASSLLVEPERTNLITYSEDFSNAVWSEASGGSASNPVLTNDYAISPDGTQNATRCLFDMGGGTTISDFSRLRYLNLTATNPVISIYIKSNNATTYQLNLSYGGDSVFLVDAKPNEWTRVDKPTTASGSFDYRLELRGTQTSDDIADVLIWGVQAEEGSYATSYIPTDGGTVTRVKDTVVKSGFQSDGIFGSTEGSAVFDLKWDLTNYVFDFEEPSGVKIRIFNDNNSTWRLRDINGAAWYFTGFTISEGERSIIAFKWSGTEVVAFQNGDKSSAVATFASSMAINSFGSGNNLNNLSSMKFYKTALTDDELKTLTTI